MKCLVTGGAGFIGSNLALELESQGHEVTVVDNLFSGSKNNLKEFKGEFICQDISQWADIREKFDAIFHLGANAVTTFPDDIEMFRQNINGFLNMLKLAIDNESKFVYASSAAVYGDTPAPSREEGPFNPLNAYGESKLMSDTIAKRFIGRMHIVGLRYFNVFGPRESFKGSMASMIFQLYQQMKSGKNPRIFNDGRQKRDHIYVKDIVKATILAAEAPSGIYNVGTGSATSFNEIIKCLNEALGTNLEPDYFDNPYKGRYQDFTQADMANSGKHLKFKADFSVKEGVKDYVMWLDDKGDS